jgi:dihydroorotate dehydrogenase
MERQETPDLAVELCGLTLANPFVLASGPLSFSAKAIRAAFAAGAGAVVTKTISSRPTINPIPHMADIGQGALLNTEGWSDLTAEAWVDRELPALRERDGILIASLGHTAADVEAWAGPVAAAGWRRGRARWRPPGWICWKWYPMWPGTCRRW